MEIFCFSDDVTINYRDLNPKLLLDRFMVEAKSLMFHNDAGSLDVWLSYCRFIPTIIDKAPMRVLPPNNFQIAYPSYCTHVLADTWLLVFEKHPEAHTNRYTCMVHIFDIFQKQYDQLRWTGPWIIEGSETTISCCSIFNPQYLFQLVNSTKWLE